MRRAYLSSSLARNYRGIARSWQSLRRSESPMGELPANLADTASDSSVLAQHVVLMFRTPISSRTIFGCPHITSHTNYSKHIPSEGLSDYYVRPYFEANVKALATVARHDWTPSSEGLFSLVKCGKMLYGGKGGFASSDLIPYADIDKEKEKGKKKKKRS